MKTGCKVCYILSIVYSVAIAICFLSLMIIFASINVQQLVDKGWVTFPPEVDVQDIQLFIKIFFILFTVMFVLFLIDCALSILFLVKVNSNYFDSNKVFLPVLSTVLGIFANLPFLIGGIMWLVHLFGNNNKNKIDISNS